ncbi:hypothetical protein [Absidia glauca]|uniref:SWIM-type domain-containing protein n=1 Tax=Absidia glauca TaxID=4829 RepID=A0A163J9B2_ABSGL|nr:hypothetical protein [Absidia glauca]
MLKFIFKRRLFVSVSPFGTACGYHSRPHYEDIRNIAKKNAATTYRKDSDDHTSFDLWLGQLADEGCLVFLGQLNLYRAAADRFAKRFLSQAQYVSKVGAVRLDGESVYLKEGEEEESKREAIPRKSSLYIPFENLRNGYTIACGNTWKHQRRPRVVCGDHELSAATTRLRVKTDEGMGGWMIYYAQMVNATAFCLDATYNVVRNREVIMYSLVVAHRNTGQGYPVAYMLTNDHTVGPLVQWLGFLKSNAGMNPSQITIDCSIPEVNAIKATFSGVVIRFCAFHVVQAMKRQVERVVFLSGAPPSAQSSYRDQIICDLRGLVGETDLAQFEESYNKIKADYSDQENLLAYLERNWMTAEKLEMWSDAHRNVDNANMRTNNFIESWHNQLKTFLGHRPNRRLDRLLYILITDVAFYHRSQFERISRMIGKMGPIHHENSMREYRADKVPTEDLNRRIVQQNDGHYTVQSAGNGDIVYQVSIIDDLIHTCTCQDYQRRIQPCKHLYMDERLLERTIKVFLPSDLDIPINAHVSDTSVDSSDEEDLGNDDEIE